ncbi:hypothetical protein [Myroides odoratus]|uniref:hypothetical protein n=1 Tax=Myroides odoratus TaxID=256 RepID=UPI0033413DF0
MNNINFNQTGGFPLSTNILDAMQEAYQLFNELGEAVGKNCILSGCNTVGVNISDGVVVINGEILPFKGSGIFLGATVAVRETIENKIFEDATSNPVIYQRYAQLTTGEGIPFSSLPRIKPMVELTKAAVPVGLISMWSGALRDIPLGWVLCDGQNGTPDLRDRFIVGAGKDYSIADVGGAKEVALTVDQIPSHRHTGTTKEAGKHSHTFLGIGYKAGGSVFGSGSSAEWVNRVTVEGGAHSHSLEINETGGSKSHENRPPYFALAFIMFKG